MCVSGGKDKREERQEKGNTQTTNGICPLAHQEAVSMSKLTLTLFLNKMHFITGLPYTKVFVKVKRGKTEFNRELRSNKQTDKLSDSKIFPFFKCL